MSGHSKWSTIKRQKAATDQKRGQIFTKLAAGIIIAVKTGGGITDPASNFKLRLAIDRARAMNMPKENIDRAISRASAKSEGESSLDELLYEGFGPSGSVVLVAAVTDNRNRSQSEVRLAFSRNHGQLAQSGAVIHQFVHRGEISVDPSYSTEILLEHALSCNALDVNEKDHVVYTNFADLHSITEEMKTKGVPVLRSEIVYAPLLPVELSDDDLQKLSDLIEALEALDDVQNVYVNVL